MGFGDWKDKKKKAATPKSTEVVSKSHLLDDDTRPIVYRANVPMMDLKAWYSENSEQVEKDLHSHGAVLFRGFNITSQALFKSFTEAAITSKAAYIEGATPRTELAKGIYTSTAFPEDEEIDPHNELSYVVHPPSTVAFCCLDAPDTGGQTPITDVSRVYQRIDKAVINTFESKGGWLLRRNYGTGFGPTINKAFGIDNMEGIREYCDKVDVALEVISDTHVATTQVRSAVHHHPVSKTPLWFNHVVFWHPTSLCPKVRVQLESLFSLKEFPYSTYFGDGSAIPDDIIAQIRQAYQDEEMVFDWADGDILVLDNWRIAHGRKPFTGSRNVLVAMG